MATTTKKYKFKKPDKTDYFNIGDQNNNWDKLDKELEKSNAVIKVDLPASGWSGSSFPYTQTVAVEGFTDEDEPVLTMIISNTAPEADVKAYKKAFGFIFAGTVNSTGATFYASKKPATEITVGLKGR